LEVRFLLDTHILLWSLDTPERLPCSVREKLESPLTEVYFSATSTWEIAIKSALGKISFRYSPDQIAEGARKTGFVEIPVSSTHAAGVARLSMHHHDRFDRFLIAQALAMPARLVTADAALIVYSEMIELGKNKPHSVFRFGPAARGIRGYGGLRSPPPSYPLCSLAQVSSYLPVFSGYSFAPFPRSNRGKLQTRLDQFNSAPETGAGGFKHPDGL
jgi:PIN domain nuclease of toxin-antitoxin system